MDKRQRAMLKEMGVRVWQPLPGVAPALPSPVPASSVEHATATNATNVTAKQPTAITSGATSASKQSATAPFDAQKQSVQAISTATQTESTAPAWRVGAAQTLYVDTAVESGNCWLVLLEAPASALQDFKPLDGDAGKLLDNMLRAARLHTAGAVLVVPLVRGGVTGAGGDLPGALTELLASAKADVVLVMGRLAAQALLQSTEPLAKLRGQIHTVQGQQTIITIDPTYLLRNPLDKAKAWDDLCLAISHVTAISTPSS